MEVNPHKSKLSASAAEWTPGKSHITATVKVGSALPSHPPLTTKSVPEFKPSAPECNDSKGNLSPLKKVDQGIVTPNFQSPVGSAFSRPDTSKKIARECLIKEIETSFDGFDKDFRCPSYIKLEMFIKYLLKFPQSTVQNIPKNLLERLAAFSINSLAIINNYELSKLAFLFCDLDYKPDFLVKSLVLDAINRIPHCNAMQLFYFLMSFDKLYGYRKDSPLFSKIIEAILFKSNRFTVDQIVSILYFFRKKDGSQTHLFDQLMKATIDLTNIDLANLDLLNTESHCGDTRNKQDPLFFQMSKKSILESIHFCNSFFHGPIKNKRFTPARSDTSIWDFLNPGEKKNLFLNTMANRVIPHINEFTTEDFERVNLDPTAVKLLHQSIFCAQQPAETLAKTFLSP